MLQLMNMFSFCRIVEVVNMIETHTNYKVSSLNSNENDQFKNIDIFSCAR